MKNEIVRLTEETPVYCSLVAESRKEKAILYNAVENPSHKISEFINKNIKFINVHLEKVQFMEKDENGEPTGVVHDGIKTVLITPEGEGIICNSNGIARSLFSMFQIFGTPDTWDGEPMEVTVKQIETPKGRTFKLEVV